MGTELIDFQKNNNKKTTVMSLTDSLIVYISCVHLYNRIFSYWIWTLLSTAYVSFLGLTVPGRNRISRF